MESMTKNDIIKMLKDNNYLDKLATDNDFLQMETRRMFPSEQGVLNTDGTISYPYYGSYRNNIVVETYEPYIVFDSIGVSNLTYMYGEPAYILFLDIDRKMSSGLIEQLQRLANAIGNIYLIRTNGGYHGINFSKFTEHEWKKIMFLLARDGIDDAYHAIISAKRKMAILRIAPNFYLKDVIVPTHRNSINYECSNAHYVFFAILYEFGNTRPKNHQQFDYTKKLKFELYRRAKYKYDREALRKLEEK